MSIEQLEAELRAVEEELGVTKIELARTINVNRQLRDAIPKFSLKKLREKNVARCIDGFHRRPVDWSETDWGCAIAGEAGELCNILKKRMRDGETPKTSKEEVSKEIADVILYLDLLAARLNVDLEEAIVQKFNEVSNRVGSSIKMEEA